MELKVSETVDVAKSIDFLQRINIKQISEYMLQESISQEISFYFTLNSYKNIKSFKKKLGENKGETIIIICHPAIQKISVFIRLSILVTNAKI